MRKKSIGLLCLVVVLGLIAAGFARRDRGPDSTTDAKATNTQSDADDREVPPPPTRLPGGAQSLAQDRYIEICGRIANYERAGGPAVVAVSVPLPGTGHRTRAAKVDADGRFQVRAVAGAPIQLAVSAPGAPAGSLYIAKPIPCAEREYALEFAAGPVTTIGGSVSDAFGGPLASAAVDVIPVGFHNGHGFEQPVFRVFTGNDGTFAIAVPANEYAVRSEFPGYAPSSAYADTTQRERVEVALTLAPGAVVSGRVVLAGDRTPVAQAELRFVPLSDSGGPSVNHVAPADAISNPDGSFVIDNLGSGSWAIFARTDDAVSSTPTEVSIELFDDVRDVVVEVEAAPRVYGVVRERTSEAPVPDALVLLQSPIQSSSCSLSDAEGVFDCGAVSPGTYTAIVAHDDYAGNLLGASVRVDAEPSYLELEVERGHTVSGQVWPAVAGVPVHVRMDVEATLKDMGFAMMNAFRTAKTDADGRFSIGPLSLGELSLVAEHPEHGRGEVEVNEALAASGTDVEIQLGSAGVLDGRVSRLGETDAASLEVILTPVDEPMRIDGVRQTGAPMYTVPVAELGTFTARGLEPGTYSLRLQHSRGAVKFNGPAQIELVDGRPTRVELELTSHQRRFAGTVVDEDGGAIEGAVVYLAEDSSNRALSDSHGAFTLGAWTDGDAIAARYHRAGYSTAAGEGTLVSGAGNRLVVPTVASLEVAHPGAGAGELVVTGKTRIARPLGKSGTTVITGLLEGRYEVHVCSDEGFGHGQVELTATGSKRSKLTVETKPWVRVEGVAIGPEGAPLAGAQLMAIPANDPCNVSQAAAMSALTDAPTTTDADGAFAVTALPPGSTLLYFFDVTVEPPRELMTTVDIPATASHELGEVRL